MHHQFLANSLAIKAAHEIAPNIIVSCMIAWFCPYPVTCRPEDVLLSYQQQNECLFFTDVMMRGYYPSYMRRFFKENGIQIKMEEGDEEILRAYTSEYRVSINKRPYII